MTAIATCPTCRRRDRPTRELPAACSECPWQGSAVAHRHEHLSDAEELEFYGRCPDCGARGLTLR